VHIDEAVALLDRSKLIIKTRRRLGNEKGEQLRLENGAIINVFDNGTVDVQGKNPTPIRELFGLGPGRVSELPSTYLASKKMKVFVVYGHDPNCRTQLEAMLRRWDLEPLILDQLPSEGQTVIEKLEASLAEADFGVVLATPDDEGFRVGRPDEKALRARQNVVLELGMLLAKLGRPKVAILLKTQDKMEKPSDIQGLIYIPFVDDVAKDAGVNLAKALAAQGYQIDITRL
jgi:predicted nucleotide-binding protein